MNTKLQGLPGDKVSFQSLKAFKLRKNTCTRHYVSACLLCPTFPKLMTFPWKEAAQYTWSCQDSHLSQGLPNYWLGRNHDQIRCLPGIQEIERYARVGPGAYWHRNKAEGGSAGSPWVLTGRRQGGERVLPQPPMSVSRPHVAGLGLLRLPAVSSQQAFL